LAHALPTVTAVAAAVVVETARVTAAVDCFQHK